MSLCVVPSIWNRRFGFRAQAERRVSVLRNAMIGSTGHQASCSVGNGEVCGGGPIRETNLSLLSSAEAKNE